MNKRACKLNPLKNNYIEHKFIPLSKVITLLKQFRLVDFLLNLHQKSHHIFFSTHSYYKYYTKKVCFCNKRQQIICTQIAQMYVHSFVCLCAHFNKFDPKTSSV